MIKKNLKPAFFWAAGLIATASMPKPVYALPSEKTVRTEARETTNSLASFLESDDAPTRSALAQADCVVHIANAGQGGLIFGGLYGHGLATCRTGNGWSQPAYYTLKMASFGAVVGYEKTDILMLFIGDHARENLEKGKVTLGADYNVIAGDAEDSAGNQLLSRKNVNVLTYARSRGLFVNVSVKGGTLEPMPDYDAVAYNKVNLAKNHISALNISEDSPAYLNNFLKVLSPYTKP